MTESFVDVLFDQISDLQDQTLYLICMIGHMLQRVVILQLLYVLASSCNLDSR